MWPGDLALHASILTYYHENDLSSLVSIYQMVVPAYEQTGCEPSAARMVLSTFCSVANIQCVEAGFYRAATWYIKNNNNNEA